MTHEPTITCPNCGDMGILANGEDCENCKPKSMSEEILEIGMLGKKSLRRELKFGDVIENGWAGDRNPIRFGIVVRVKEKTIECTNGEGRFWELCFNKESKIAIRGSILLTDWESDFEILKEQFLK